MTADPVRGFSTVFCFVFIWFGFFPPFPFLRALPNISDKREWSWRMVIFLYEILFLARTEGLNWFTFLSFVFFIFSVFLICQWLMVAVWTLIQNTDHDFKEWTKSLLRNSFVLTWGVSISVDVLLYIGFNCSVKFVCWVLIILLTIVDFERKT